MRVAHLMTDMVNIIHVIVEDNGVITHSFRPETPEEIRKRNERGLEEQKASDYAIRNALPLYCDMCSAKLGFVYANDLEGSKFYCDECTSVGMPLDR